MLKTLKAKMRRNLIAIVVLGLPIIIILIGSLNRALAEESIRRNFEKFVGENNTLPDQKIEAGKSPYLAGKIVVLDVGEYRVINYGKEADWDLGKLDKSNVSLPIYNILPENLKATNPEEVGTVVLIKWDRAYYGSYIGAGNAYKINCIVSVVDKKRNLLIDQKNFEGGNPPYSIKGKGDGYGNAPSEEILNYLTSLPLQSN
jgi:hypothetical protein